MRDQNKWGSSMLKTFKNVCIIFVLIFLAACQSSKNSIQETNFHIASVDVRMPTTQPKAEFARHTDGFDAMMTNTISHHAAEYNAFRPSATRAYDMKVEVDNVHFKNPLVSLLVGDANHIKGTAYLIEPNSNKVVHTMPIAYVDGASAILNGVSGAVLSVAVKKEAAEGTMSKGFARAIMKKAFPKVKLTEASTKKLGRKEVFQPINRPMSKFSRADVIEEQASVETVAAAN